MSQTPDTGGAPTITQPPVINSVIFAGILWFMFVPCGLILNVLIFPVRLLFWFLSLFSSKEEPMHTTFDLVEAETTKKATILFIHGFPDTGKMFRPHAEYFAKKGYKSILITLPGVKDGKGVGWGKPFAEITKEIGDILVANVEAGEKVEIIAHDWGCIFAGLLLHEHHTSVKKVALFDVATAMPTDLSFLIFALSYQLYFAFAFAIGGMPGTEMIGIVCQLSNYNLRPRIQLKSELAYFYFRYYMSLLFSSERVVPAIPHKHYNLPVFFGYGTKRKGSCYFCSNEWLASLWKRSDCQVKAYKCGHWIPTDKQEEVLDDLLAWLEK